MKVAAVDTRLPRGIGDVPVVSRQQVREPCALERLRGITQRAARGGKA